MLIQLSNQSMIFPVHPLLLLISFEFLEVNFLNLSGFNLIKSFFKKVPESSRVETQLKICIQLQNQEGENITNWRYLLLSDYLIGKKYPKSDEKIKIESSISLLLEAGVICASDPSKRIFRCLGCVQRERKNEERKKKNQMETNDSNFSVEKEQEKLLQIYCNPILDFSHGEVIIPSRITCYCRHHDEKEGFRIWVKLRDLSSNSVIASEVSSVVLITDNHKTAKNVTAPTKAMKRPRLTQEVHSDDDLGLPEIEKIIPNEGSMYHKIQFKNFFKFKLLHIIFIEMVELKSLF